MFLSWSWPSIRLVCGAWALPWLGTCGHLRTDPALHILNWNFNFNLLICQSTLICGNILLEQTRLSLKKLPYALYCKIVTVLCEDLTMTWNSVYNSYRLKRFIVYILSIVWVFCLYGCLCAVCLLDACGGQRSDLLELKLYVVVNYCVGPGNRT